MEKKKLKLKISEGSKKTINNIELAKSKASNSVVIAKKNTRTGTKSSFSNTNNKNNQNKSKSNFTPRTSNFSRPSGINDYEKRKLAEQRATKRLRGENTQKSKIGSNIRRELKLTLSRALSDEDIEFKGRSLASLKRAKQKENKENQKNQNLEELKPIKRDINIPEVITIRELANRMAEQSSNIIKHLLSMGVTATINHSINSDIAEYLVQEFGHNPIKEKKAEEIIKKLKKLNLKI